MLVIFGLHFLDSLIIRDVFKTQAITTTTATRKLQICIFNYGKNSFARFARAFFCIFCTFRSHSRPPAGRKIISFTVATTTCALGEEIMSIFFKRV